MLQSQMCVVLSCTQQAQKYGHHMLFLFVMKPTVHKIVNENKKKFSDLVENAIYNYGMVNNLDSYAQQENDEVQELLNTAEQFENYEDNEPRLDSIIFNNNQLITDDEINANISTLNDKQKEIFEVVIKWSRDYIKKFVSCS